MKTKIKDKSVNMEIKIDRIVVKVEGSILNLSIGQARNLLRALEDLLGKETRPFLAWPMYWNYARDFNYLGTKCSPGLPMYSNDLYSSAYNSDTKAAVLEIKREK